MIILDVGLPNFNLTPECYIAFRLLACFEYLMPCGVAFGSLCREVRDNICMEEWWRIGSFLGPGDSLPVCEELPGGMSDELGVL